jgi:hypothetical protein
MKKLLIIAAIALLPGCALIDSYLMKYDTNEYRIVTEIRAEAQGYKTECSNPLLSAPNAIAMADKTRLLVMYSQYLPYNEPTKKSSVELDKVAQGLKDQYAKGDKVSPMFCKLKFETIEHSAESMQKVIGAKPR